MFQALCNRRNVRLKYERFANAQTAAAVYNVNRGSADDPTVTAFDFVRDEESAKKKEALTKAKRFVQKCMNVPPETSLEKILEIRRKAIADLKAAGYENAEDIFNSMWPSLAAKARWNDRQEGI